MRPSAMSTLLIITGTACLLAGCRPAARPAALAAVARWEDQRRAPADSLAAALADGDARVRAAAVRAAGRIGDPAARTGLTQMLTDRDADVREEAAFALGLLGDPAAAETLASLLASPDRDLRRAAIAGLALLPHDGRALMHVACTAPAAEAAAAWDALIHIAAACDQAELHAAYAAAYDRPEADVRWRALRCAQRAPDSTLVAAVARLTRDVDLQVQVHAVRALGFLPGDAALAAVLDAGEATNAAPDAAARRRGQIAAVRSLAQLAGPALQGGGDDGARVVALLAQAAADAAPGNRREAFDAIATLGATVDDGGRRTPWRDRLRDAARAGAADDDPQVRAAAVAACAALYGDGWDADLPFDAGAPPAVVAAWLRAWGGHGSVVGLDGRPRPEGSPRAWRIAADALAQPDAHPAEVRVAAVEALVAAFERRASLHPRDLELQNVLAVTALDAILRHGLVDPDFTVRTTATGALAGFPLGWILEAALGAYQDAATLAEGADDVRLAALDAVAGITGGHDDAPRVQELLALRLADVDAPWLVQAYPTPSTPAARDSLQQWLTQLDPHAPRTVAMLRDALAADDLRVRLKAREVAVATDWLAAAEIPGVAALHATLPSPRRAGQPPLAPSSPPARLRCVTARGSFDIVLDTEAAPSTCAALLAQTVAGLHDHGTFHRVVPDFVIQGGDPRGDGWGGPGYALRSEISRRPFLRGTVGIADSGKDSGGSQWFVCLSPQPHLNGRYTVCGEVVAGMDVVDAIAQGDRFRLELLDD